MCDKNVSLNYSIVNCSLGPRFSRSKIKADSSTVVFQPYLRMASSLACLLQYQSASSVRTHMPGPRNHNTAPPTVLYNPPSHLDILFVASPWSRHIRMQVSEISYRSRESNIFLSTLRTERRQGRQGREVYLSNETTRRCEDSRTPMCTIPITSGICGRGKSSAGIVAQHAPTVLLHLVATATDQVKIETKSEQKEIQRLP